MSTHYATVAYVEGSGGMVIFAAPGHVDPDQLAEDALAHCRENGMRNPRVRAVQLSKVEVEE